MHTDTQWDANQGETETGERKRHLTVHDDTNRRREVRPLFEHLPFRRAELFGIQAPRRRRMDSRFNLPQLVPKLEERHIADFSLLTGFSAFVEKNFEGPTPGDSGGGFAFASL